MSVKVVTEPAPWGLWRVRSYAEEYGSPSENRVLLKCNGKHTIEIIGGNTGYEEGGIIQIRVDGKVIFEHDQDNTELWADYWRKHPKEREEYSDG
jgi:hypothetical protein